MKSNDRSIENCTRKQRSLSNSKADRSSTSNEIGILGENLVAEWLQTQGWSILQKRWRCRWGELDIIAIREGDTATLPTLIFVEVKTRRRNNWDADGILAISKAKQTKLWQAGEMFLSDRPELANYPCRFDVALVRWEPARPETQPLLLSTTAMTYSPSTAIAQSVLQSGDYLLLQDYIHSAFTY